MSEPFIVFTNPGVIDPRSIKSFGVSVKDSSNPIGYFGTGLKYALAIFARLGVEITIQSGTEVFKIGLRNEGIRGKEFQFITMNDEELSFTTELGKNWEPWQAFREIYCNCIDEKGSVDMTDLIPLSEEGVTKIILRGRDASLGFHERHEIVLNPPSHLQVTTGEVEVYDRPSQFLYYRGVRVLKFRTKAHLTYNVVAPLTLTEDRTLLNDSDAFAKLPRSIALVKDEQIIRRVVTSQDTHFEHYLDFDWLNYGDWGLSEEFERVLQAEFELNNELMNRTARNYYRKLKDKKDAKHYIPEEMTPVEKLQLEKCQRILPDIFPDFADYPIMTVKSLGSTTMALADMERRRIILAKGSFRLGTKFLMATLVEEYMHLKTGYGDQTRQLQTYLFDTIITMIEDHVLKEPV